jgi:hypothetical protein
VVLDERFAKSVADIEVAVGDAPPKSGLIKVNAPLVCRCKTEIATMQHARFSVDVTSCVTTC